MAEPGFVGLEMSDQISFRREGVKAIMVTDTVFMRTAPTSCSHHYVPHSRRYVGEAELWSHGSGDRWLNQSDLLTGQDLTEPRCWICALPDNSAENIT